MSLTFPVPLIFHFMGRPPAGFLHRDTYVLDGCQSKDAIPWISHAVHLTDFLRLRTPLAKFSILVQTPTCGLPVFFLDYA